MSRHPYAETAALLRDLARLELRRGGKWADRAYVQALRAEATVLDRQARNDDGL